VIICTNADEIKQKLKLFTETFEVLKKANIKVKFALSGDKNLIEKLSETFKIKIVATDIDAKFFIVDKQEILFYLSKGISGDDTAIWLNSDFFSEAFASLFEKAMEAVK